MKIGIIGLGKMGQNHLNELGKNKNFKINALFDMVENKNLNAPFFTNLDEFLNQDNDIIIIATPTNSHLEIARKVFCKCKCVLIEKPLALNLNEIDEISNLAKDYDVKVGVGFCERFNPAVLALKKELQNEEIISINIQRFSTYPQRISDVGILQDLAVHDLDLLHFLSGEKITNANILKSFNKDKQREDESIIACKLEKTIACVHQSWNSTQRLRKITLVSKNHFYEANLADFSLSKDGQSLELMTQTPLFGEHMALYDLFLNKENYLANIQNAYAVQEILEKF
ncbi:Gfo/Idh/MocA family oxidoreductase [Campylobacter jejuni]|nr:Gfo/Idh/MocA family oxidoreductase [Campylobacter coli]EAH8787974.1 Gfo/Idh/MocA family oxidoreductase [Campylobacter jejuni]EAI7223896.1 Gfo/Idh/MocA family oxidoreductase [Campylobacter coli]EAJ6073194.1 Gfo/Idh/MocA family oxidoreductase [Campylobacter coli]EAK2628234.1 Gfo/Idh/MocA family oxidoreductase [Campylobacter coli]